MSLLGPCLSIWDEKWRQKFPDNRVCHENWRQPSVRRWLRIPDSTAVNVLTTACQLKLIKKLRKVLACEGDFCLLSPLIFVLDKHFSQCGLKLNCKVAIKIANILSVQMDTNCGMADMSKQCTWVRMFFHHFHSLLLHHMQTRKDPSSYLAWKMRFKRCNRPDTSKGPFMMSCSTLNMRNLYPKSTKQ